MKTRLTPLVLLFATVISVCGDLDAWNNGTNSTIRVGATATGTLTLTNGTATVTLAPDAADVLAVRNSATAQTVRVYKTYTDASNNYGLRFYFGGGNPAIETFSNGTGSGSADDFIIGLTSSHALRFKTANSLRWQINSSGHIQAEANNTYDIGLSSGNQPRNIYAGTSVTAPKYAITGTTNQVVFGGTNTAPVSSVAPTKWISVQVTGETNSYRLPLYE